MTHKIHDTFAKKSLSRKSIAKDLFETYLPDHVRSLVDFDSLKQEKSDMYGDILGEGIVDLLYSAEFKGNKGYMPIFLLIEHQSSHDEMMAFRIQKYVLRICDEHIRANKDSKLPLIYPTILWAGKGPYRASKSFYELFEDKKLAKQFFTDDINVIDVSCIEDYRLRDKYQLGLMLYAMKHIHDKSINDALRYIFDILKDVFRNDFEYAKDVVLYILEKAEGNKDVVYLLCDAAPKNKRGDIMTIAEQLREEGKLQGIDIGKLQGIDIGKLQGIDIGMEKGMEKGKEAAMVQVAKAMLAQGFKDDAITSCTGLSLAQITSLKN